MIIALPRHGGRRRGLLLMVVAFALLGAIFGAERASALEVAHHTFSSSTDGTGTTGGPFGNRVAGVGVDETSGAVYLIAINEEEHLRVDKFDAAGNPSAFSAPELAGASTMVLPETHGAGEPTAKVAVDNSAGATQGRFYVTDGTHAAIYAFEASGEPVAGSPFTMPKAPIGIAVSPNSGDIWALFGSTCCTEPTYIKKYTPAGVDTGIEIKPEGDDARFPNEFAADSEDNVYVFGFGPFVIGVGSERGYFKYDSSGNLEEFLTNGSPMAADLRTDDLYFVRYAEGFQIGEFSSDGTEIDAFKSPMLESPSELAVNGATGTVYVSDRGTYESNFTGRLLIYTAGAKVTVPKPTTGSGENFQATSVTLDGTVDPAGVDTTECHFEWGTYASFKEYEHTVPCDQGQTIGGSGAQTVTATISGLTQAAKYHVRLVTANSNGRTAARDREFVPSAPPALTNVGAGEVHSDIATLHATVNPGGAETHYHFEYGLEDCSVSTCTSLGEVDAGSKVEGQAASVALAGLTPGTDYHYRIVAENQSGVSTSTDRTFRTFAAREGGTDLCSNAHVRQQTGAAQLLDCRAYELVSAGDTAGYDVESDLVPGQEPYGGFPEATNPARVLYAVHGGGIPGTNHPTNRGPDPYVATRGEAGWTTEYVGVPADNPYSLKPFSSTPSGASAGLSTFSFGGPEGCSPCFPGQYTGIPVRLADGALVQGMAGSLDPGPTAAAEGFIGRQLSADGSHLVFGSKAQFESDGNDNGDISIYDRDLAAEQTHVVSKTPGGATMTGPGIAEVDLSADGSHIVIGQLVSTDADGNAYYHLYMTVDDAGHSVDLTPGASDGALFDGMSADGTRVYFTTADRLSSQDTDESPDIYMDELAPGATSVEPALVSKGAGGPSNDDSCEPPGEWNVVSGGPNCGALAIAGGGGVSADGSTIFFLSPELLDGAANGTADQPNLYVVRDGGAPHFVATVDSSIGKPGPPPPTHPVEDAELVSGLSEAGSIAYDPGREDLYVVESGASRISRFTAAGAPDDFSAGPGSGTNQIGGLSLPGSSNSQVAVNASNGDFYVTDVPGQVPIYGPDGASLGALDGSGTSAGSFSEACGVAVDQASGDVYVGDYGHHVWRYHQTSSSTPLTDADFAVTGIETAGLAPCNVAVDSAGNVYASAYANGPLKRFEASDFAASPPSKSGLPVSTKSTTATADPQTGDLYVDEGDQIALLDSSGQVITHFGSGALSGSRGVSIDPADGHAFAASDESKIVSFGLAASVYKPIDDPTVVHALSQAGSRDDGDFQITPDGEYAAFPTAQPIKAGYDNEGHVEIYRYGQTAGTASVTCVSCNPTGVSPVGDASMASAGLSLVDDGRVFFTSPDGLVSNDGNEKRDVYEWENGDFGLISTGASRFDSSLLSASSDGTDAYFFTRDTLAPQDTNGPTMKIYDARSHGGFEYVPPTVPCKASDECHGPGTEAAAPPAINSVHGDPANAGTAKRKKKHRKHHHRKRHHRKGHRHAS